MRPSKTTSLAMKDGFDIIVEYLMNFINSFFSEKKFPTTLKPHILLLCSKKIIMITLKTIGLSQ